MFAEAVAAGLLFEAGYAVAVGGPPVVIQMPAATKAPAPAPRTHTVTRDSSSTVTETWDPLRSERTIRDILRRRGIKPLSLDHEVYKLGPAIFIPGVGTIVPLLRTPADRPEAEGTAEQPEEKS
jgi:hypothetical protein